MFVVIYKNTNKIIQTIDKNYGIEVSPNELLQEITDQTLIDKINSAYEYNLVFDSNGNMSDINVTKTLEQYYQEQLNNIDTVKQNKKSELSQACQNAITGGFHSTAYQSLDKIYDSTLEDQANITGNALSAMSKLAGTPGCENDTFYYHARGEGFTEWTPEETLALARDFKVFKEQQLLRNSQLQAYVDTLTTAEEVQAVTWDTVIPT